MTKQELTQRILDRNFEGTVSEYQLITAVDENITWAWENWEDDVLRGYDGVDWNGDKPEDYPDAFAKEWIDCEPFDTEIEQGIITVGKMENYKLSGLLRNDYQSEPSSREFIKMGEYAVGDDGCVYQFVDKDDAISFLIYDCVEENDMSFNYAEDETKYELIEEGEFDKIFSEKVDGFEISEFYKEGNVRIKALSFYERTLYRIYFDNQSEGYPISEDCWDNVDVADYDVYNEK